MKFKGLIIFLLSSFTLFSQDAYHTNLLQNLATQYQLQNGEWVFANSEVGNHNIDSFYGNATLNTNTVTNQDFSRAARLQNFNAGDYFYDVGYSIANQQSIQQGDNCLMVINLRRISNRGKVSVFINSTDNTVFEENIILPLHSEWTQYLIPFQASRNYGSDELLAGVLFGWDAQEFEVAGMNILNFGNRYTLDQLPRVLHNDRYEGYESNAPWRNQAAQRIEQNRKSNLTVEVVDANGTPVENATVEVNMLDHSFQWGVEIALNRIAGNNIQDDQYENRLLDMDGNGNRFNWVVPGNSFKWLGWENNWMANPAEKVNAIRWLQNNDFKIRQHTMVWPGWGASPDDLEANANPTFIRNRTWQWIEELTSYPGLEGVFEEYDIINELAANRDYERTFAGTPGYTTGREIYPEIMAKFAQEVPNVPQVINDYVTISQQQTQGAQYDFLKNALQEVVDSQAPLSAIGFQAHIAPFPTSIYEVEQVLNDFGQQFNLPLKITEYDTHPDMNDQVAAQYLEDFLTMVFSLEQVEMFMFWGFWDGYHWFDNGNFYDLDWNLKPAGQVAFDKIFDEWWTEEMNLTTSNGRTTFRPFKGQHEIVINYNGIVIRDTISLENSESLTYNLNTSVSTNPTCNLITNGNFDSDLNNWGAWSSTPVFANGSLEIRDIQVGENPWEAAVTQQNLTITQGQTYTLTFDARAFANRDMGVKVGLGAFPHTAYFFQSISLSPQMQTFSYSFTMMETSTTIGALEFFVGTNSTGIILDNISLLLADCGDDPQIVDNDNDGFNSEVDCDDNNPNINPGAAEIANNQADENCDGIVLIIDDDNDGFNSDIDCDDNNAAINPNAIEIANNQVDEDCDGIDLVTTNCNLITNGNFDNDINNWGAWNAMPVFANGSLEIRDIQVGENPWEAAVTQGDLAITQGQTYTLTFDARAFASRDMGVKVGLGAFPHTNYFFQPLTLSPQMQTFSFSFTMMEQSTTIGALEFFVGTNSTVVVLDNISLQLADCGDSSQIVDNDNDGFNSDVDCDDNNPAINPNAIEIVNNQVDENCDGIAQMTSNITISEHIKVDQFGYLPTAQKIGVISNPMVGYNANESFNPSNTYEVRNVNTDATVYTGNITAWENGATHDQSGDQVWWFDFSPVTSVGNYYLFDPVNQVRSYEFNIAETVYNQVLQQAVRVFYHQRCGTAHTARHSGVWNDETACHIGANQDLACRSVLAPNDASTALDLSGGWHDAGDYNKYVIWSYEPIHDLLFSYQESPSIWGDDFNIPESGNGKPDILDEVKWELDWLLKMQLANGSVLMKVSGADFSANSPASADNFTRYYAPAQASATRVVASVFAHASMVYRSLNTPADITYANLLLQRAELAWNWVVANPAPSTYDNRGFTTANPELSTEEQNEVRTCAAAMLYAATGNTNYRNYFEANYNQINSYRNDFLDQWDLAPTLQNIMLHYTTLNGVSPTVINNIQSNFVNVVTASWTSLLSPFQNNEDPYRANVFDNDYIWGSNFGKCKLGSIHNDMLTHNLDAGNATDYRNAAAGYLHYLHGVNPMNKVMLTNMGAYGAENSCNELYHAWFGDGTVYDNALTSLYGPPPGFMYGGPNETYRPDPACNCTLSPPQNQPFQKSFLDFNTGWPENSWEISETSITYASAYVRLLAKFVTTATSATDVTLTTTSSDTPILNSALTIFPNPSTGIINIKQSNTAIGKPALIEVYDLWGRTVYSEKNNLTDLTSLDLAHLSDGVYFLKINGIKVQRFVITNG